MRFFVPFLLIFLSVSIFSQKQKTVDWNKDLAFIKNELPKDHYNFYAVRSEEDFFKGIDQIAIQENHLTNFQVGVKLQQLIASFGDPHTLISLKPYLDVHKILPLGLMWCSDGLWIQFTTKENEVILGSRLLKINDIPLSVVVDSLNTLLTIDNQAMVHKKIPQLLLSNQLLEYFGFSSSEAVKLTVEKDGRNIEYNIHPSRINKNNITKTIPDQMPLCYQKVRAPFWETVQRKDNILYVQYNKCFSRENPPPNYAGNIQKLPSFTEFSKAIIDAITQNDFDKIVFDLRFNQGGNSDQGTEFIKELASLKKLSTNGKLFVIIGRDSFSSAIINIMDFKKMINAILVGEETSGKPNHFGEVREMKLPYSGLIVRYSTKYFKETNKDVNTVTPDKIIEASFKDFKEGRDPVYEWIAKQ